MGAGAVVISLLSGFGASVVLHRLLRDRIGDSAAMWAVAFFACGPLAAMFQVGYAESLFLLLLFLALRCVQRRRWGWLYVLVPVMGFTRPGILAFALFLGLYGVHRFVRRRVEPLPLRDVAHLVGVAAVAVVVGFAWQVIAGVVTGDSAPTSPPSSRGGGTGSVTAPEASSPWTGGFRRPGSGSRSGGLGPVAGYVALVLLVLGTAAVLMFAPQVKRLGVELRLWSASYLIYLLLVFFPQSSIFRLLLPISPLWGALAVPPSRAWRLAVLAAALLGQWWWIYNMYGLGNTYWQIP